MAGRRKMVVLGLYSPGTGFTHLLQCLLREWAVTYEVHWIGIGYKGPVEQIDGYRLLPNNLNGGDMYGAYGCAKLAHSINADIVFMLCDTWMLLNLKRTLADPNRSWKNVAYIPLDGEITDYYYVKDIDFLDLLVAYHEDGLGQFEKAVAHLQPVEKKDHVPMIRYAYHGVDAHTFFPFSPEEKAGLKQKLLGLSPERVVVLNANRVSDRKDLYTTISGFAEALKEVPELYLVLHLPGTPEVLLRPFQKQIEELGINHACSINPLGEKYVSFDELNLLYNACDIGINTSRGEGWGMIAFEHGAAGAAQLVPDHTASKGLWHREARLEVSGRIKLPTNPFLMYQLSASDVSQKLKRLGSDPAWRAEESSRAMNLSRSSEFQWPEISQSWITYFDEVLNSVSVSRGV